MQLQGEDAVQTAEPMKNHTTFRVGGPADYFVAPHTEEEIRKNRGSLRRKRDPVVRHRKRQQSRCKLTRATTV